MNATHSVQLTEDDIIRAVAKHVASKVPDANEWELDVQMFWRAKKAIVSARRKEPIPTLTDAVHVEGHTA